MDLSGSADRVLLEGFRLDRRGGCLFRVDQGGVATPVALGSRAIDLLGLLVERKGELVSKDAIMAAVWPGRVVEEAKLNMIWLSATGTGITTATAMTTATATISGTSDRHGLRRRGPVPVCSTWGVSPARPP